MTDTVVIAVVSDIHASDEDSARTHVRTPPPAGQPLRDPIGSLHQLVDEQRVEANIVLSAGDMTDRTRPAGIHHAWNFLVELKGRLKADHLIATAGNHDLDSRFRYTSYDARGQLLELEPSFPIVSPDEKTDFRLANHYWARDFAIIETEAYRVVTLNSAAYHGYSSDGHDEWKHGRVTSRAVARIRREIEGLPSKPVNVLLCHHHPFRIGDIDLDDYSEMRGGEELIDLLRSGRIGRWMVVHGHKHFARFTYGPGGSYAPMILSAGSLGADLYGELGGRTRNQFYLVRFHLEEARDLGVSTAGTILAWNWAPNLGWQPSPGPPGLPAESGFGYVPDAPALVQEIRRMAERKRQSYLSWKELCGHEPRLRYVTAEDLSVIADSLRKQGLKVLLNEGRLEQVGLANT